MGAMLDPAAVGVGAMGELIAMAIAQTMKSAHGRLQRGKEGKALKMVAKKAFVNSLIDARRGVGVESDHWLENTASIWVRAFTADVMQAFIRCIADSSGSQRQRFAEVAVHALEAAGCDLDELNEIIWVDQFLDNFPRVFWQELQKVSLDTGSNNGLRELVAHLLSERAQGFEIDADEATPRQFLTDLMTLMEVLDRNALQGRLPAYLPSDADVLNLTQPTYVRKFSRLDLDMASVPAENWDNINRSFQRIVVLGHSGVGKSWLIRMETHLLASRALTLLANGRLGDEVVIPIPIRCDRLLEASGAGLAEKAANYLVEDALLNSRSVSALASRIRDGKAVVMIDALDESAERYGQLKALLHTWLLSAGDSARCIVASRIAGYVGPPAPDWHEVSIQPFTDDALAATIEAWNLRSSSQDIYRFTASADTGGLVRIPLFITLLCSMGKELPNRFAIPQTKQEILDRVIRWFLTRPQRGEEGAKSILAQHEVDQILEIVTPIAYAFASHAGAWAEVLPSNSVMKAIRRSGEPYAELRRPAGDILRVLTVETGILTLDGDPSAGRSPKYGFPHRMISEYLVARYLAYSDGVDWFEEIMDRWSSGPSWGEVTEMLGEQLDLVNARKLILHLISLPSNSRDALLHGVRILCNRPDYKEVLARDELNQLVHRVLDLFDDPYTRADTAAKLAFLPRLPHALIYVLSGELYDVDDDNRRFSILYALAGREGDWVQSAILVLLNGGSPEVRTSVVWAVADRDGDKLRQVLTRSFEESTGWMKEWWISQR
jgi:hypothetical protein